MITKYAPFLRAAVFEEDGPRLALMARFVRIVVQSVAWSDCIRRYYCVLARENDAPSLVRKDR